MTARKPRTDHERGRDAATRSVVPHILTVEEIISADDLGSETVDMPEWGGSVRIRGLSMDDIYKARKAAAGIADAEERRAMVNLLFVVAGVVEPMMTPDMVTVLRGKSSDAVLRLIERISALNGATAEVRAKAEADFPAERAG